MWMQMCGIGECERHGFEGLHVTDCMDVAWLVVRDQVHVEG